MASTIRRLSARLSYGLLFVAVLPLLLALWTAGTADVVALPARSSVPAGAVLIAAGVGLMTWGAASLWRFGGGLPMNAFPPPRPVSRGIYGWIAHPMYAGFVLACAGVAFATGSASGLWLATPFGAAAAAALVIGYERPDLRRRFGDELRVPRISLPPDTDEVATGWQRLSVYALVLLPWLIVYEAIQYMGIPTGAIDTHFAFEAGWPVIEWTELPYVSVYVLVLTAPLVARRARSLRRFALNGLVATSFVSVIYLTVPFIAPPRPFEPSSMLGRLLAREQAFNHTVAAFPAFHVVWAFIAADAWPRWRTASHAWAATIAVSCVTTGMHSVADVASALLLLPVLRAPDRVWEWMRSGAERVANSWHEWRWGRVRIINHGLWGGLAAATGTALAGWLAGPDLMPGVAVVAFMTLLGAGLWAQWLEGSSVLLRPFGFYGGLLGGLIGCGSALVLRMPVWTIAGAFAVSLPWTQAIGRVRCLVQGCCHGAPAPSTIGIRYRHSRSRVRQIAHLAGEPLHPTPLYSILGNVVIGVLLLRLWSLHVPASFVVGASLALNGLARFVEESFRAEPQTKVIAGLHIYHWIAIASVMAGLAVSTLRAPPTLFPPDPGAALALVSVLMGILAGVAMGVDFPESNRRFSRLATAAGPSVLAERRSE